MPCGAHPETGIFIFLCSLISTADALGKAVEQYSTNAICRQNYCINPLFPALEAIPQLEASVWQVQKIDAVRAYMRFCKGVVNYNPAVPSPNSTVNLESIVKNQEKEAVTSYYFHLAGMNLEALDYKKPGNSNDACIRSVWTMVCNTYFPQATIGGQEGQAAPYVRPCKNVCQRYMEACNVQCCDESAQCVFEHAVSLAEDATNATTQTGYVDVLGPSAVCTGGTFRSAGPSFFALILGLLALFFPLVGETHVAPPARGVALGLLLAFTAVTLQACDVVGHAATTWETKSSYLVNYQYVPIQGKHSLGSWQLPTSSAVLNSCEVTNIPDTKKCSGNGICRTWNPNSAPQVPIQFCECDRDWADPECRTRRKSQMIAYVLSLFTGYLGFDHFYLGEYYSGCAKLATLGGVGIWWVLDIVRIGSAPIYTSDFRLAADLPHAAYVVSSTAVFAVLGVLVLPVLGQEYRQQKLKAKMLKKMEEDFFRSRSHTIEIDPRDARGMPTRTSHYVPVPLPDGGGGPGTQYGTIFVPETVKMSAYGNQFSTYTAYANATANLTPATGTAL